VTNMRILAVDDNPTMRRIILNTLRRAGYNNIIEAFSGRDALARLQIEDIDLVLTDWDMPEMNGLELVSNLRKMDKFKTLPIIMISTRSIKEDIIKALQTGVNCYIVKPFTPDILKQKIKQIIND
jgi:two-component system, chemotaxis family, chemotaxis protein CheY